jgi:hypothetical protein
MSAEENKIISWSLQEEVVGQGKLGLVDELLAPDYVSHAPGDPELRRGPEDIKEIVRAYHSAFLGVPRHHLHRGEAGRRRGRGGDPVDGPWYS